MRFLVLFTFGVIVVSDVGVVGVVVVVVDDDDDEVVHYSAYLPWFGLFARVTTHALTPAATPRLH